jgi:glycerate kinase
MRIIVAPDSFKGSLSAELVAEAMAGGVRDSAPQAEVLSFPMADGGEGTIAALASAGQVRTQSVATVDAIGRPLTAVYGWLDDSTAIIELAQASGLPQVSDRLSPLQASTRGTGLLILDALRHGASRILLSIGGSATTDGGAGILAALGARLLDSSGNEVPPGGAGLSKIEQVDLSGLNPLAMAAEWQIACDVTNPLLGPTGAAAVFGPQKGATPQDVVVLDAALGHWARILDREMRRSEAGVGQPGSSGESVGPESLTDGAAPDWAEIPGMGAAGGVPAGLVNVFDARLLPGALLVANALGLPAALSSADLLITGEGSFDSQSMAGKVVGTLAGLAAQAGVPVVVIAGSVGGETPPGILSARSIARGPASLSDLMKDAAPLIRVATRDSVRLFLGRPESC